MGSNNVYVLSEDLKRRMEKKLGCPLSCERCGKELDAGALVVSKPVIGNRGYLRSRFFHTECWESMFIEVEA